MTEEDDNLSPATNYSEITPQIKPQISYKIISSIHTTFRLTLCVWRKTHFQTCFHWFFAEITRI